MPLAVSMVRLPPGKDPADIYLSDKEELHRLVQSAKPPIDVELEMIKERIDATTDPSSRADLIRQGLDAIHEQVDPLALQPYQNQWAATVGVDSVTLTRAMSGRWPKSRPPTQRALVDDPEKTALAVAIHRPHEMVAIRLWMITNPLYKKTLGRLLTSTSLDDAMVTEDEVSALIMQLLCTEDPGDVGSDIIALLVKRIANTCIEQGEVDLQLGATLMQIMAKKDFEAAIALLDQHFA
jgi:DNA primase